MLLLRLAVGAGFLAHGISKFTGLPMVVGFFGGLGLSPFFAYLVATVETLGGIALILGAFTEVAAALLAIIMVVAIILVKFSAGYLGGFELDTLYLGGLLAILFAGPGRYAFTSCCKKKESVDILTTPK